ncbi:MAG TPA: Nif3-like dinuclear metal center hexameric protein [Sphingobacteriaceae bacterium]|nr:Nif3-like dinuclear metal center hexameric protein [Sphingobacteriaceae bacterium]
MKLRELTTYLERFAPLAYQESYDNSGLLVGDPNQEIQQALICLDCTEAVVDEAIQTGCQVVIAHHPLLFKGLKKLTGANYVERTVLKAIRNNIALYAIHTNLDNVTGGVNSKIADRLNLSRRHILSPKSGLLRKLVVFVPINHVSKVRNALFSAGAGSVGAYDQCSFNLNGTGTFRAGEGADPFVGDVGEFHEEEETRVEVMFPHYLEAAVLQAMRSAHPYEEVAYDLISLENRNQEVGSGMIGELPEPMNPIGFLQYLKEAISTDMIRHTALTPKKVKRVAVCGGSGGFLLPDAIRAGADVFVTADYKYHEFFDADGRIIIADVGHFESEQFTQELLLEIIQKKFPTFAVRLTGIRTNPINYYS